MKTKVIFKVPKQLQQDLRTKLVKDGYGLHQKSIWISEAIFDLFKIPNYKDLVSYGDEMTNFEIEESAVISQDLKKKLELEIIEIRREYPALEGLKSRIIRTAILQRIIR